MYTVTKHEATTSIVHASHASTAADVYRAFRAFCVRVSEKLGDHWDTQEGD